MYIFGSECTLTLVRGATITPIPYTQETLREEREETQLDPLVGIILPLVTVPCGTGAPNVLGCTITRVCSTSLILIAALLANGHRSPFSFLLNRIAEKRIYSNLSLTGFEVRADRDEALYIRLDVEGNEATDWDITTPDIPWIQNETLHFYDGDLTFEDKKTDNIYRFSLTRMYGDSISTVLQLHYPLKEDDLLNNIRNFDHATLTFGGRLRFTLTELNLLLFSADTDNAEEILVVRRYRIDGDCLIEICNEKGEWMTPS